MLAGQSKSNFGQILSRPTKEAFQNGIGLLYSGFLNTRHRNVDLNYFDDATVVHSEDFSFLEVTLGSYIFGTDVEIRYPDGSFHQTFKHAYGLCIQSQRNGPLYLYKYGVPSTLTYIGFFAPRVFTFGGGHGNFRVERDASQRGFDYFKENCGVNNWNKANDPRGPVSDARWWEPFVFTIDPLAIIRINRP